MENERQKLRREALIPALKKPSLKIGVRWNQICKIKSLHFREEQVWLIKCAKFNLDYFAQKYLNPLCFSSDEPAVASKAPLKRLVSDFGHFPAFLIENFPSKRVVSG